jgi:DNA-binding MarR family transcriptional regulator/catechol 2,3-dioxygenase-like lactoylglutathione lyase family enzyme
MAVLTRIAAENDLSLTQLRVLGILQDRRLRISTLAAYLGLERSTLSGLVDRAERRGLVERADSREDRRATEVTLTDAGRSLAARVRSDVRDALRSAAPTSHEAVSAPDRGFTDPQVILFSDDLTRAAAFYARLGFVEVFRTASQGEPIHLDLELDGYRIGLASGASTREDHGLAPITSGQRAAVVVWTRDVPAAWEELVAGGAPAVAPPHGWLPIMSGGDRLLIAWTADPDGNPVQLVQRVSVRSSSAPGSATPS